MRPTTCHRHAWMWVLTLLLMPATLKAQYADEEYRMEVGARLGGTAYMGDANYSNPLKEMGLSAGLVARYMFNPRMALKCDIAMGKIAGDTRTATTQFPEGQQVAFDRTIYDVGVQFEYNFWPYGNGMSYRESRLFTPYLMGGMGLTIAPAPAEDVAAAHFSLGVGVKYKFAPRWNVGVELAMRFTGTDKLDVTSLDGLMLEDPFQVKGGMMKNKDSYSMIGVTVTYDIWPRCDNCNKD
ncbi:MAG: outer membrane beta-barrel protein [Bacteroidaceae bacterium]|nr:outer membrane beta-barrel protein [Bacteroidaceae bacterium]